MSYLLVCRLDQIAQTAVRHRAREMVSLLARDQRFHRPAVIDPARHLHLGINDIDHDGGNGLVPPEEHHVAQLIEFARGWNRQAPLVLHCWFGISRSPAAALIAALAVEPDQDEVELARRLRAASPYVTPNRRLVSIADRALGRGGQLAAAVEAIGRGAETGQGDVFRLDLPGSATSLNPEANGHG